MIKRDCNNMLKLQRAIENPLLSPAPENEWEQQATFNPCVFFDKGTYHMLYRALSPKKNHFGVEVELSTIGYAESTDGIHFTNRRQILRPEHDWEFYGCEDPRVTKIDDMFYIFYTCLSTFPFSADGIKVGVALTKDFRTIEERHLVTPFNAKAMSLFPQKVNGKIVAILTVDTDQPPAKIGIAYFDRIEELWDHTYWENWYNYLPDHTINIAQNDQDHVEIGAPPVLTDHGWLLLYSYIKDYFTDQKHFTIKAMVLQKNNPKKILSRTDEELLAPEKSYEKVGIVPDIVFPSGVIVRDDHLSVYYGGADTVSCLATCSLSALLREMTPEKQQQTFITDKPIGPIMFKRFDENPILRPIAEHPWEEKAVFNPAAFLNDKTVHMLYRALSDKNISTIGYASSKDGMHIDRRLPEPVYTPREGFEKNNQGENYGCEDPRITVIDETVYMCYTAYDGSNLPRVAFSSIPLKDFLSGRWDWKSPKVISHPEKESKDACLFPEKINNTYSFLHGMNNGISIDYVSDLTFADGYTLRGNEIMTPRSDKWDSKKIGIAGPPIKTAHGWVLLYHGIDNESYYNLGAALLEREHPETVLARLDYPVLIPEKEFEKKGRTPNVVFPCGHVIIDETLIMYYGAADSVIGVASIEMPKLLDELIRNKT